MGILSYWVPLGIYISSFIVGLLTIFYKGELGLAYLVFFIPLQNVLQKLQIFPLGNHFFDILVVALIIAWLKKGKKEGGAKYRKIGVDFAIYAYIFVTFLSFWWGTLNLKETFFAYSFEIRLSDWKNFALLPILYLVTVNNVKDKKWIRIILICGLSSILFANLFFIKEFGWYKQHNYTNDMRVSGPFAYLGPNELGAFFAQYGVFLFGLFLFANGWIERIFLGSLSICNLYCLMYSFSRAGYLAFPLGLAFILILKNRILFIFFVGLLILLPSILPDSVIQRIEMTTSSEETGVAEEQSLLEGKVESPDTKQQRLDPSAQGRFTLWDKAFEMFNSNPIFGVGFNTYRYLYGWDTHNNFLKILAESGIIGFLIYLYLYYLAFRSGWQLYRVSSDERLRGLGFAFCGCVLTNIVVNLTHDNWTYINLMGLYWVLWGLVIRGKLISKNI